MKYSIGRIVEVESHFFKDGCEFFDLLWLGLRVLTQDGNRWEVSNNFLGDCDIAEKHKFFDERIGIVHLIELHVNGIVRFVVERELHLRRSQCECSVFDSFLFEFLCEHIEISSFIRSIPIGHQCSKQRVSKFE